MSNVFDEALFHCAESLATNYWLDFTKSESFKNITRKKKGSDISLPFGDDALKKAMKKGNIPGYIFDAAFGFFNGEEVSTKTKLKDCESFETVSSIPLSLVYFFFLSFFSGSLASNIKFLLATL